MVSKVENVVLELKLALRSLVSFLKLQTMLFVLYCMRFSKYFRHCFT